ncbi:hypothetical protein [Agreia sp. COWG]|uniref:hypothetical protein n=1 Tax=Agreia sp. COWG TaxID=2773266 RepID=UPI001928A56C|nr:hypothetical protein [Agreia sp. COWG]CAD5999271.1 conserved protein of unknown function [Agreia sp. COWG]
MATLTHPKGRTVTVPDEVASTYLENGWSVAGKEPESSTAGASDTGAAPDDLVPTDKWTNERLEAHALEQKIDLGGATRKADLLAAIAAGKKIEDKGEGNGTDTGEGHSVPAEPHGDAAS